MRCRAGWEKFNPKTGAGDANWRVGQAFQPAGSGDFPVAGKWGHGTGMSRSPAGKNVGATTNRPATGISTSEFGFRRQALKEDQFKQSPPPVRCSKSARRFFYVTTMEPLVHHGL
jgi:hypothetical protein